MNAPTNSPDDDDPRYIGREAMIWLVYIALFVMASAVLPKEHFWLGW